MAKIHAAKGALRSASQSVTVAAPAALTGAAAAGANPTKAEYDKTVADVVALRSTVAALLTALKNAGIVSPT